MNDSRSNYTEYTKFRDNCCAMCFKSMNRGVSD